VFDVLLQVLGEGRLTDGTGRTVRFGHTIVILTSNLGATRKEALGFGGLESAGRAERQYMEAAARFFRPELLNRIDHLVPFAELGSASIRAIAVRLLDAALEREGLARRRVRVERDPAVLEVLVAEGFDPRYGARPMKRAVESLVTVPLAKLLMTWPEATGRVLRLAVEDGRIVLREG
jgi:ATP-dependent Clp protease ATP-binding subunit ClpC